MIRVLHCSLLVVLFAAVDGVCACVLAGRNPYPAAAVVIVAAVAVAVMHQLEHERERRLRAEWEQTWARRMGGAA